MGTIVVQRIRMLLREFHAVQPGELPILLLDQALRDGLEAELAAIVGPARAARMLAWARRDRRLLGIDVIFDAAATEVRPRWDLEGPDLTWFVLGPLDADHHETERA